MCATVPFTTLVVTSYVNDRSGLICSVASPTSFVTIGGTSWEPVRWATNFSGRASIWPRISPPGLAAVWILFAVLEGANFVGWSNQRLMLLQTAVVATAALGGTIVIISGGIDLSVGSAIACGTMIIGLALIESISLYGFVVGILLWQNL